MARARKEKIKKEKFHFPLEKRNYIILISGILLLLLGFFSMTIPDHPDDFLTLTLAPVLLFLAFVVVIPVGLLYKKQ